jgi:DNA-binding NtrC family response regulator
MSNMSETFVVYHPEVDLAEIEKQYIIKALEHHARISYAAKALGITCKTLYNKLHKYGLFERYRKRAE